MKKCLFLLAVLAALSSGLSAQPPSAMPADVATTWHGVNYRVFHVERIAGNRLLIGVEFVATPAAPPGGTVICVLNPPPPKINNPSIIVVTRKEGPFSLDTAVLTDEQTKQTYEVVPPDPAGPNYLAGQYYGVLRTNEVEQMTIQFPCPPPPHPDQSGAPVKQTVSLLLPNAKGPITGIEIPPPAPVAVP